MAAFHAPGLHGYSLQFSPFQPNRFACVMCQNYGISGDGVLLIIDFDPNLVNPMTVVQKAKWPDGLFDISWSEKAPGVCCTASGDGAILLWNEVDSAPLTVWQEHKKEVYAVDWCHLGEKNLIVSGSWDSTAKVWDAEAGKCLETFQGHFGVVYNVVWSPHVGGCFASCSADGTARIWDCRKAYMPQCVVGAHETEVLSCDWSKYNSNILVTASVDCSVRVWDIRNPKSFLCQMLGHNYAVRRIRCSPFTGQHIASCSYDFTVRTWDYMKPQGFTPLLEVIEHHSEFVYGLDFSTFVPGLVGDCSWDQHIRLYKPKSLNVLQQMSS